MSGPEPTPEPADHGGPVARPLSPAEAAHVHVHDSASAGPEAAGPRPKEAGKRPGFLASILGRLPGFGRKGPSKPAEPSEPADPSKPADAGPSRTSGVAPTRWPFSGMRREARVGIAAVVSFSVLVGCLIVKKSWGGGSKRAPVNQISAGSESRPAEPTPAGKEPKADLPPAPSSINRPQPQAVAGAGRDTPPIPSPSPGPDAESRPPAAQPGGSTPIQVAKSEPPPDRNSPTPPADPNPAASLPLPGDPPPTSASAPMPDMPPMSAAVPPVDPATPPAQDPAPPGLPSTPAQASVESAQPPASPTPEAVPPPPAPADPMPETPPPAPPARPEVAEQPTPAPKPPALVSVPAAGPAPGPALAASEAVGSGWVVVKSGGKRSPVADAPRSASTPEPRPIVESPRAIEDGAMADQVEPVLHRVEPGENFWTISKLYYRSPRFYKALHAANKREVPDIAELYVGTVLRVPPPEALDRALVLPPTKGPAVDGPAVRPASRRSDPADEVVLARPVRPLLPRADETEDAPAAPRPTYKVKPNETLRSIARDALGDSRRDREIFNLNRDLLDDPKSPIPPGSILTLPEDAVVGRRGR